MSTPSKKDRKALIQASANAAELARERRVEEDVSIQGMGERVLHVRRISAFGPGRIWDVRRGMDELSLYSGEVNPKKYGYLLPGYTHIDCETSRLRQLLDRLSGTPVPVWLPEKRNMGLDGVTTHVEFRHGFATSAISWWQEGPPEWAPFTRVAREVIGEFERWSNPSFKRTPDSAAEFQR